MNRFLSACLVTLLILAAGNCGQGDDRQGAYPHPDAAEEVIEGAGPRPYPSPDDAGGEGEGGGAGEGEGNPGECPDLPLTREILAVNDQEPFSPVLVRFDLDTGESSVAYDCQFPDGSPGCFNPRLAPGAAAVVFIRRLDFGYRISVWQFEEQRLIDLADELRYDAENVDWLIKPQFDPTGASVIYAAAAGTPTAQGIPRTIWRKYLNRPKDEPPEILAQGAELRDPEYLSLNRMAYFAPYDNRNYDLPQTNWRIFFLDHPDRPSTPLALNQSDVNHHLLAHLPNYQEFIAYIERDSTGCPAPAPLPAEPLNPVCGTPRDVPAGRCPFRIARFTTAGEELGEIVQFCRERDPYPFLERYGGLSVSPDGRYLAYSSRLTAEDRFGIFVLDLSNGQLRGPYNLAPSSLAYPSWFNLRLRETCPAARFEAPVQNVGSASAEDYWPGPQAGNVDGGGEAPDAGEGG